MSNVHTFYCRWCDDDTTFSDTDTFEVKCPNGCPNRSGRDFVYVSTREDYMTEQADREYHDR